MRPIIGLFFLSGIISVFCFSVCPAGSDPATIQACGISSVVNNNVSSARTLAIRDAQRNAVQMGLGTLIDSRTMVNKGKLLKDKIYSQASGYVKEYSITSEGLSHNGTSYEVCLDAVVQLAGMENDLRAIGILRQHVNPRFMTLYVPRRRTSLLRGQNLVTAAELSVNKEFVEKGFVVLDRDLVWELQNEVDRSSSPSMSLEALSAMAFKKSVEILLVLDVGAMKRTEFKNKYFGEITFDVGLQVVEPATGTLIVSSNDSDNVRLPASAMANAERNTISESRVRQLASRVAESALGQTVAYLGNQIHSGTRYSCIFWDFNQTDIFAIVAIIEKLNGFKGMDVRNQRFKTFEVDVQYLGKRFDFQRALYEALIQHGIHVRFQEGVGNTLKLIKEKR